MFFLDDDASKAIVFRQNVQKAKEMLPVMKIITIEKIIKKDDGEMIIQSKEIQETFEELKKLPIIKDTNGSNPEELEEHKKKDENIKNPK